MDQDFISRREHEAFSELMKSENQRLRDENDRQNKRISALEDSVQEISKLAANTEKLAANMENMLKAQEQQGQRLEKLEGRDGEMWRKVVGYIATAVVGIILGFIFTQIGIT